MPLEIIIREDNDTNNLQEAELLKNIFENSLDLKDKNGEILIFCNKTYTGYRSKKIDFIITGYFEEYSCKTKTKAIYNPYRGNRDYSDLEKFALRNVIVENFFFTIESKQDKIEDLDLDKFNMIVNKNQTNLINQIKTNPLSDYINNSLNLSPFICHFYWYKNISSPSLIIDLFKKKGINPEKYNYLPETFNFSYLIKLACRQKTPYFQVSKNGEIKGFAPVFRCLKTYHYDYLKIGELFGLYKIPKQTIFHELGHLIVYCLSKKIEGCSLGEIEKIEFNVKGNFSFIRPKVNLYYRNNDYNNNNSNVIKKNAENSMRTICWIINQISGCIFESYYLNEDFEKCFCSSINCSGSKDFDNLTNLMYEVFIPKHTIPSDEEYLKFNEKINKIKNAYINILNKHSIFFNSSIFLDLFIKNYSVFLSNDLKFHTDESISKFLQKIEKGLITESFIRDFSNLIESEKDNFKPIN